ncbi:MAG: thioesterase family protein [Selenomonadaceae bacterium]|nr:thioesterase family protein [Selenomonadaceae bacterium]
MADTVNLTEKLTIGLTKTASETVNDTNTAKTVGSGSLNVYATPMMIARMEEAAANLAEENLPAGYTSVGILMNVAHTAATPCGLNVTATAVLTKVEGKKLTFEVKAEDEAGEIGKGVHERFIVESERFQQKADSKKS